MLSKNRIKSIIESLLFLSDEPLNLDKIREIFDEEDKPNIKEALLELKNELDETERGIIISEVAGAYQLRTLISNTQWIFRLTKAKPAKLSRASIETLSIVAYRQPITKQEVESIRGVDSGWTIKTLLEKNLVKIIGKKEEPGNPLIYATTKAFLEFFNLNTLDDLPTLREYHELSDQVNAKTDEPELEFSNET